MVSSVWAMCGVFPIYATKMEAAHFWFPTWFFWSVVVFRFSCSKLVWVNSCHGVESKPGDWPPVSRVLAGHHLLLSFGSTFTTLLSWRGTCSIYFRNGKKLYISLESQNFSIKTPSKSFSAVLPWSVCGNWWNTVCCSTEMINITEPGQKSELVRPVDCPTNQSVTYPEAEYWKWVISCQL